MVGSIIEVLMAAERVEEAWDHLERWYRHARGGQAHPTKEGLYQD